MPSNTFQKFAFGFAIVVLGLWGGFMIFSPELVHAHFSTEPLNRAQAGMMGAALLGLALISLSDLSEKFSARRAFALAVIILVAVALYQMFGTGSMLVSPLTSISLVAATAVAFFLMI